MPKIFTVLILHDQANFGDPRQNIEGFYYMAYPAVFTLSLCDGMYKINDYK